MSGSFFEAVSSHTGPLNRTHPFRMIALGGHVSFFESRASMAGASSQTEITHVFPKKTYLPPLLRLL